MENSGEQFLHKKDTALHISQPVQHEVDRRKNNGETVSNKPADEIAHWLNIVERVHKRGRDVRVVDERIKNFYHKNYVIREEDIPSHRYDDAETIIQDQKESLDKWVDYFSSKDSDCYPMWVKYWAFKGMLRLSTYDKEKQDFGNREDDSTAMYPEINTEALGIVLDLLIEKVQNNTYSVPDDATLKKLLDGANFGKLYAYAIEHTRAVNESNLKITEGTWKKYEKGTEGEEMCKSLEGYGTGWCTVGRATTNNFLKDGDIFVYYSNDLNGDPVVPRVTIRMKNTSIAELRGIAKKQNLDPYILDVVEAKLNEITDDGTVEYYKGVLSDQRRLNTIEKKIVNNEELSADEILLIYSVKRDSIRSFINVAIGEGPDDKRLEKVLSSRNKNVDLDKILNILEKDPSDEVYWIDFLKNNMLATDKIEEVPKEIREHAWRFVEEKGNDKTASTILRNIKMFQGDDRARAWRMIESQAGEWTLNNIIWEFNQFNKSDMSTVLRIIDSKGDMDAVIELMKMTTRYSFGDDVLEAVRKIAERFPGLKQ